MGGAKRAWGGTSRSRERREALLCQIDIVCKACILTIAVGKRARRLWKDLAYFGLVAASLPLALAEAAFGAGSTVMIEARRP